MKKIIFLLTIFCGVTTFAQTNQYRLDRTEYSSSGIIGRTVTDSRTHSTRVFESGAIATGGMTSTVTSEIDSMSAPSTSASWVLVIYSIDGVIEWDSNRNFTGVKTIYSGTSETTAVLNANVIPRIYLRRKSGQTSTVNYSISSYGY